MFCRLCLTAVFVTHAAAAFLGHAGLHAVLGMQHCGHRSVTGWPNAALLRDCSHDYHACDHSIHGHLAELESEPSDCVQGGRRSGSPNEHLPAPHHHDGENCLLCQYCEQVQTPLEIFQLEVPVDSAEEVRSAAVSKALFLCVSNYDSRGPPVV